MSEGVQQCTQWFNSEWFIALFSFVSAIIGGLIQSWISHKFTNKEVTLDKQREAYAEYLCFLQDYINKSDDNVAFENFQKATNKVLLFASDKTARLINQYFSDSTTIGNHSLTKEEHQLTHNKIFESMRDDLTLSNECIGICSLSRYDPSLNNKTRTNI